MGGHFHVAVKGSQNYGAKTGRVHFLVSSWSGCYLDVIRGTRNLGKGTIVRAFTVKQRCWRARASRSDLCYALRTTVWPCESTAPRNVRHRHTSRWRRKELKSAVRSLELITES